jgi:hypothetical protein
MRAVIRRKAPRAPRIPERLRKPRVEERQGRERILRERVTYMLWVMAQTVD